MVLNRRRFLTALGLGGAATALRGAGSPLAFADDDLAPPKRLIILSTCHGSVHAGWRMRPGGQPDDRDWQAPLRGLSASEFSRVFEPLHAHRQRINLLEGLSMASAELDIAGYRHEKGWLHAWTGAPVYFTGSDLFGTAPSLDQLVARHVARPDRLASLELNVMGGRPICHGGEAQPLPLEASPRRVYERLFGLSDGSSPLSAARGSALDYALAEHGHLSPRLRAADRERLAMHFDLVRQLEQRIQGLATARCEQVPEGVASTLDDYDGTFRAYGELIAAAFACDLTRVATLSMGDLPSRDFGWGDYLSGDAHNDFAHRLYEDDGAADAMSDYNRFHAGQLAWLISLLESIPEDGGSVMDNTVIVWGNELADGWHGYERYPAVVAGGSWAFDTGRYLHWSQETPVELVAHGGTVARCGLPHQHLLVSVAQAMGLDTDQVGSAELYSRQGDRIDARGPLFELLR